MTQPDLAWHPPGGLQVNTSLTERERIAIALRSVMQDAPSYASPVWDWYPWADAVLASAPPPSEQGDDLVQRLRHRVREFDKASMFFEHYPVYLKSDAALDLQSADRIEALTREVERLKHIDARDVVK